jgi:tetratricopeptide (TPR) repeat protein
VKKKQGSRIDEARGHVRRGEALRALQRAVAADPTDVRRWKVLGDLALDLGRHEDAVGAYARALDLAKDDLHLQCRLGLALERARKLIEAEKVYRRVLKRRPDLTPIRARLGVVQRDLGSWGDAAGNLKRAIEADPGQSEARLVLSDVVGYLDGPAASLDALERSLKLVVGQASWMCEAASMLAQHGEMARATNLYRQAIARDPDLAIAYLALARAGEYTDHGRLQEMLRQEGWPPLQRSMLWFALAWIHHHEHDVDQAFSCLREANDLLRGGFDPQKHRAHVDQLVVMFTAERFSESKGGGSGSEMPVFVVGMPRSGTSLVEQALASHPEVYGAGELKTVPWLAARLAHARHQPFPGCLKDVKAADIGKMASEYLKRLPPARGDARRVVDKLPDNFLRLGLIALAFPRATVIHCRRHPLDVGLSCYFQLFKPGSHNWAYDLGHIGSYHRQYQRVMETIGAAVPLRVVEVQYETLVADFESTLRDLLAALGLSWHPDCLAFHRHRRRVHTASAWEVRQPVYGHSVARHLPYKDHLDELIESLGDTANAPSVL